jgi:predicted ATP-grasp superfamily ATP-dependent carboligase
MRVFIYEYTCAEGNAELPASLRTEGWAMLAAVLADFRRLPGVEVSTLLHESWQDAPEDVCVLRCNAATSEASFREPTRSADYTLVIAPECEGLLETRCRWVKEEGGRSLGASLEAIGLCRDKLELARQWRRDGVPTPDTHLLAAGAALPTRHFPLVCKPRDGAGSQATFQVNEAEGLRDVARFARSEGWSGELIFQPFVPGRPASVALVVGARQIVPLLPAGQELSRDGRFRYRGGVLPLPRELCERAQSLATKAVASVPGLRGYVGVDLVLGEAADGSCDFAIEINPRLTTSYVGLRALARSNLADLILKAGLGEPVPAPAWRDGHIHFRPDGTVTPETV